MIRKLSDQTNCSINSLGRGGSKIIQSVHRPSSPSVGQLSCCLVSEAQRGRRWARPAGGAVLVCEPESSPCAVPGQGVLPPGVHLRSVPLHTQAVDFPSLSCVGKASHLESTRIFLLQRQGKRAPLLPTGMANCCWHWERKADL